MNDGYDGTHEMAHPSLYRSLHAGATAAEVDQLICILAIIFYKEELGGRGGGRGRGRGRGLLARPVGPISLSHILKASHLHNTIVVAE